MCVRISVRFRVSTGTANGGLTHRWPSGVSFKGGLLPNTPYRFVCPMRSIDMCALVCVYAIHLVDVCVCACLRVRVCARG